MVEKKYKSFLDDEKWYLTKEAMKDLIEKYDKKEISYDKLKVTWEMHIQYIQRFKPKEFAELQLEWMEQNITWQNHMERIRKEIYEEVRDSKWELKKWDIR